MSIDKFIVHINVFNLQVSLRFNYRLVLIFFLACTLILGWSLCWSLWLESRRFAAINAVMRLMPLQPAALPSPVPLPLSIRLRYKMFSLARSSIVLALLIVFIVSQPAFSPAFWVWTSLLAVAMILDIIPSFSSGPQIEATENGLRSSLKLGLDRKPASVAWHEAQLFACYFIPGSLSRRGVITYELSSPTARVCWHWVLQPRSPFALWKPPLPAEEYHRQVQALTALITSQTKLPLIDLNALRNRR